MKRSRTIRDTLDELFYHDDSFLEEEYENGDGVDLSRRIYDEEEENEDIGLFIEGDDEVSCKQFPNENPFSKSSHFVDITSFKDSKPNRRK
jgi:hypothetical protein